MNMADTDSDRRWTFVYVGNIPQTFRSADLRVFFSQFVESGGFHTFHFKHRPEHSLLDKNLAEVRLETSKPSLSNSGKDLVASEESLQTQILKRANEAISQTVVQQNDDVSILETAACTDRYSTRTQPASNSKNNNMDTTNTRKSKSYCCIVKVYEDRLEEFIKFYRNSIWHDRGGKYLSTRVSLKVLDKSKSSSDSGYENTEFDNLQEVNPPPEMPNGNVGTPLSVFMHLIRACKLPASVIQKLGLQFPKSLSKQRYGNVPFEYIDVLNRKSVGKGTFPVTDNKEPVLKSVSTHKDLLSDEDLSSVSEHRFTQATQQSSKHLKDAMRGNKVGQWKIKASNSSTASMFIAKDTADKVGESCKNLENAHEEPKDRQNDVEGDAEDWERHEALHDDVDAQARTKERLFEEDIELKWEKGGSGLVVYTDAYYWHEMKGKDFDEETADDWDVDMSIYNESGGGDKDARDLLKTRVEDRWHKGLAEGPTDVSDFEKYTKGFGSQQLRKRGWIRGSGLGTSCDGIADPVEAVGQSSRDKTGLGYLGVKLNRHPVKKRRAKRDVVISTIYDDEKDSEGNALQRAGPDTLKYICTPVTFVKGSKAP